MFPNKRFKFPGITSTKPTGTVSETPFIVRFYDADIHAKDARGRTMEDILTWPDGQLEHGHNYIQMLFPLPEGSAFNWEAPVIDREVMEAFHARRDLQDRLRLSFERMLHFYGLEVMTGLAVEKQKSEGEPETAQEQDKGKDAIVATTTTPPHEASPGLYNIVRGPNWKTKSSNWAVRFDHNHLRITRILRCLRVLGLQRECEAFFTALKEVFEDPAIHINERSMVYWHRAVTRPLYIAPDDDEVEWLKGWEESQKKLAGKEETKSKV